MWLLIDDVRDLNADAIARTPEAGQRLLASGPWACLCLDHDLGLSLIHILTLPTIYSV